MIEMLRIYSKGFLENVTIEELTPRSPLNCRFSLLLHIIAISIKKTFLFDKKY
jgi:hypothetical protein